MGFPVTKPFLDVTTNSGQAPPVQPRSKSSQAQQVVIGVLSCICTAAVSKVPQGYGILFERRHHEFDRICSLTRPLSLDALHIFFQLSIVNSVAAWHKALYMLLRYFLKAQHSPDEMRLLPRKTVEAQGWFKGEHWIWKLSVATSYAEFCRLSEPRIHLFCLPKQTTAQGPIQFEPQSHMKLTWITCHDLA